MTLPIRNPQKKPLFWAPSPYSTSPQYQVLNLSKQNEAVITLLCWPPVLYITPVTFSLSMVLFFITVWYFIMWLYHILFIPSTIDGHMNCFHFGTTTKKLLGMSLSLPFRWHSYSLLFLKLEINCCHALSTWTTSYLYLGLRLHICKMGPWLFIFISGRIFFNKYMYICMYMYVCVCAKYIIYIIDICKSPICNKRKNE